MNEAERVRVEHEARRGEEAVRVVADVDGLADERVAGLGEVDADLVRLAGLEANGAERGGAEDLARFDVRDRALALREARGGAADAVAAILDEVRFDPARRYDAVRDAEVLAFHRMRAQLRGEAD